MNKVFSLINTYLKNRSIIANLIYKISLYTIRYAISGNLNSRLYQ